MDTLELEEVDVELLTLLLDEVEVELLELEVLWNGVNQNDIIITIYQYFIHFS